MGHLVPKRDKQLNLRNLLQTNPRESAERNIDQIYLRRPTEAKGRESTKGGG